MVNERINIIYYDLQKKITLTIIGIVIFLLEITICIITGYDCVSLIYMSYFIISFIVIIISKVTYIINRRISLNIINVFRSLFLIEQIISFINIKNIGFFNKLNYSSYTKFGVILFLTTSAYYYTYLLFINNRKIKEKSIILFTIVLGIFFIDTYYLSLSRYSNIAVILFSISSLIISFHGKNNCENMDIIIDGSINNYILVSKIIYVLSILNIVTVIFLNEIVIIKTIMELIYFTFYFVISLEAAEQAVNSPYKLVFNELDVSNKEMNELNLKIINQNYELEQAHITIGKKEKLIDLFFENIPMPLVIINIESERIMFSNSSFLELIEENDRKYINNKKIFSIIKVEDIGLIKERHSISRGEVECIRGIKNVEMEVLDEDYNKKEVVIIFRDITDKVKMLKIEEEIKNKEFEEKLKRDFLSNISHDLKTPINVIYSATQLTDILVNEENYDCIEKYIDICKKNCLALTKFTNNLIDRSKFISEYLSANLSIQNIVEVVEDTVMSLVEYAKNKQVDIIFDTEEEEIYAEIDCDFMERITMNIISNSIKYCEDYGEIKVLVKDEEEYVNIIYEDNGVGMDEEILSSAFCRYSRGKNNIVTAEKGTGIGLFVVKKLVESQNGNIGIYSAINKGTKIEVRFKKVILDE